ncbi:MAG TPA: histidine triad nucleotide-binding protein [Actinomycetota bacterium]
MNDCLFCKIVEGEVPADVVHREDDVVAFRDINPQAPTHILIIPTEHLESARAVKHAHGNLMVQIMHVAAHLAKAEGIDRGGWRLVSNVGPDAGQTVHHLHFHLLGGRSMGWPPG